jgi:hypothetical protein
MKGRLRREAIEKLLWPRAKADLLMGFIYMLFIPRRLPKHEIDNFVRELTGTLAENGNVNALL